MPLIKSSSKKALKKNIESEMEANPSSEDSKQNLAIALDVQRRNKSNKMAEGGKVKSQWQKNAEAASLGASESENQFQERKKKGLLSPSPTPNNMAEGGEACSHCQGSGKGSMPMDSSDHTDESEEMEESRPGSIAQAIMEKNNFKRLAEGGEVDGDIEDPFDHDEGISHEQEEGPATRIKHNINARDYNAGDDRQLSEQPLDSNEDSDILSDEDEHNNDLISRIRMKMKSR